MGLFDKLMGKISNAVEKGVSKNLSGDSKIEYEKYKADQAEQKKLAEEKQNEIKAELDLHKTQASKNDLKNLEQLLLKIDVLDDRKIWVGGFDNFKTNINAKTANMFSGNKNIKIVGIKNDTFYFCKFDNESFFAYKKANKDEILSYKTEGMISKKIKIETNDKRIFTIDITENKQMLEKLSKLLK